MPTQLCFDALEKRFGDVLVLSPMNLTIEGGEFIVLVGPSGCGKSTLLRLISGLETPTAGRILMDGVDVAQLPPKDRNIAMVFQNYALYPHMSVTDNLAFGLKMRGVPKLEREQAVANVAETLQLTPLLKRKPKELSGGQRQRVALGRAMVRQPKLFLMDEPLSNLDAQLRQHMRFELAQLHQQLNTTTLYVTHDQVEALTLADRMVVLHQGVLQQVDTPTVIYNQPANLFVANFIGQMNTLPAVSVFPQLAEAEGYTVGFRPEACLPQTTHEPPPAEALVLHGTVERCELHGHQQVGFVRLGCGTVLRCEVSASLAWQADQAASVSIQHSALHWFNTASTQRCLSLI
ncbi:MAG: ABC transporter ATP-binding protein [Vampirovibrionales bacterium]